MAKSRLQESEDKGESGIPYWLYFVLASCVLLFLITILKKFLTKRRPKTHNICKNTIGVGKIGYRCQTCEGKGSSTRRMRGILCEECFTNSSHVDHNFQVECSKQNYINNLKFYTYFGQHNGARN